MFLQKVFSNLLQQNFLVIESFSLFKDLLLIHTVSVVQQIISWHTKIWFSFYCKQFVFENFYFFLYFLVFKLSLNFFWLGFDYFLIRFVSNTFKIFSFSLKDQNKQQTLNGLVRHQIMFVWIKLINYNIIKSNTLVLSNKRNIIQFRW